MGSILLALGWAGAAGEVPSTGPAALMDLAITAVLTAGVAWWGHSVERQRARHRETALAAAVPAAGIH